MSGMKGVAIEIDDDSTDECTVIRIFGEEAVRDALTRALVFETCGRDAIIVPDSTRDLKTILERLEKKPYGR